MIKKALLALAPPLAGVLLALFLGAVVIALTGKNPLAVGAGFASEFTVVDLGEAIYFATVFTFTGLAVAYSFQAGLFNIGGEGQLLAGGFVMGVLGAALPAGTPALLAVPVLLAAGFAAGASWAAVPAVMRARLGVHEVISTILMDRIAPSVAIFLLQRYRRSHPSSAEAMHTVPIVKSAELAPLERLVPPLEGSHASYTVFLALGVAALASWIVNRTRTGYGFRAVGLNPEAAHASGISIPVVVTKALLVSGGLAGLAAAPFVLGNNHYYELDMLAGAGFTGIAVAVLAGNAPLRVLLSASLMAFLTQAGEVVNGNKDNQIPKEIVLVLQALVIVSVLVAQGVARRLLARAEARSARRGE